MFTFDAPWESIFTCGKHIPEIAPRYSAEIAPRSRQDCACTSSAVRTWNTVLITSLERSTEAMRVITEWPELT